MDFLCPACDAAGGLKIIRRLELPPDSRSDEITLQIVRCRSCNFEGLAIYEESRRGALGDEAVDHRGYYMNQEQLKALKKQMRQCPKPGSSRCDCAAHQALGRTDKSGRWAGLSGIDLGRRFPMRYG